MDCFWAVNNGLIKTAIYINSMRKDNDLLSDSTTSLLVSYYERLADFNNKLRK